MSGSQSKTPRAREKLIRTFFWIIRSAGISEDDWRAFVESLYGKGSLRMLTTDELKCVVDELAAVTGIELRKPSPREKHKRENITVTRNGVVIELPTKEQLALIENLSDKMNMSQETLQGLIRKAAEGKPTLSLLSARKLIEMLKYMHGRGWLDHTSEKKQIVETGENKQTVGTRDN